MLPATGFCVIPICPNNKLFLLFSVKYVIHMKHSMKSKHTAKNINTNTRVLITRLIISTLEVPCVTPLTNHIFF